MELREIEIFLVLTEELHFGRTAERLFLSQSRVSQTIRAREERVGGTLFERTSRRVRLSPLGEQLRDGLHPAYEQIHRVMDEVRDSAAGIMGELRVGLFTFTAAGPAITQIVRLFEERHPCCRVALRERTIVDGLGHLRRGDLDLIITWLPLDEPDMTIGPILTCQERALAVHSGDPLARRGHATVEDLADYVLVDCPPGVPQMTFDAWIPTRTPSGRPIARTYPIETPGEYVTLVARGEVVHPTVPSATCYYSYPEVAYIPLHGLPPVQSALVWRTSSETAAIRAFAALAEEVTAGDPARRPQRPPDGPNG
jgi:DNA-binding transcriptional LysR family regulator